MKQYGLIKALEKLSNTIKEITEDKGLISTDNIKVLNTYKDRQQVQPLGPLAEQLAPLAAQLVPLAEELVPLAKIIVPLITLV